MTGETLYAHIGGDNAIHIYGDPEDKAGVRERIRLAFTGKENSTEEFLLGQGFKKVSRTLFQMAI